MTTLAQPLDAPAAMPETHKHSLPALMLGAVGVLALALVLT